jgi:GT2 family glycosyltransferase
VTQLSIVIPAYNNWWMTARALRALDRLRDASGTSFETIVVDNASTDETQTSMREFPSVRYQRMETNTNFAGACNAGARLATAPLVLFLNNDAYPLDDALTPLARAFDLEEVAIAGGALFFEDGATQGAGFVVLPNAHWHYYCRNLPSTLNDVTQSRDAIGVSGAAMAVRTAWFLEGGGFDESYINGFEDVDLCMRAREKGRAIRYVADARFAHYEGASAGRFDRESENERQFYGRWHNRLTAVPRTARGSVGAISVRVSPMVSQLSLAGLEDLESGLRSFGHPIHRGPIPAWRRLDRRFRESAALTWFCGEAPSPGVSVRRDGTGTFVDTVGAVRLRVPWLPCASPERVESLHVRLSTSESCATIAVAGFDGAAADRKPEIVAAITATAARVPALQIAVVAGEELLQHFGDRAFPIGIEEPGPSVDAACVLQAGPTDESAFGNVLFAQSRLPNIVFTGELQSLFAPDVACEIDPEGLSACVETFVTDAFARRRDGALVAADTRRRFSPRRSAIRVVDLLCAARFGLERPAERKLDSPVQF